MRPSGCRTLIAALALGWGASSLAAPIFVDGPAPLEPGWANLIDFENRTDGELIGTQYGAQGVTFSQPDGGRPQIDVMPQLFGYGFSSGVAGLTGSTEGGAPFPTIAGIIASFDTPVARAGAFFSDTAPLGGYTITAFGAGGAVLETYTLLASSLPGATACGTIQPAPSVRCGVFVGFDLGADLISAIQFGPSAAFGDAFAIDNLRWESGATAVPAPSTLLLAGLGLLGMVGARARRQR